VVKAISGVQTVRFKNELERNITIKLGYANAKIYKCPACERPSCYRAYGSSKVCVCGGGSRGRGGTQSWGVVWGVWSRGMQWDAGMQWVWAVQEGNLGGRREGAQHHHQATYGSSKVCVREGGRGAWAQPRQGRRVKMGEVQCDGSWGPPQQTKCRIQL
jgi:hypothetical protein